MALRVDLMEAEIRRAAMRLLPSEGNATWRRVVDAEDAEENELGETAGEAVEWSARVYMLDLRPKRGEWGAMGIEEKGRERFLVAVVEGIEGWAPAIGDEMDFGGVRLRVTELRHLPVDGTAYWEGAGVRL